MKGIKIYPSDQTGDDVVMEVDAVWASSMVAILKVPLLAPPYPGTCLALASPLTTLVVIGFCHHCHHMSDSPTQAQFVFDSSLSSDLHRR